MYYLYVDSYLEDIDITLYTNGASWMTDVSGYTDYIYLAPNTTYTLPTPTREGYVFDGWYNGDVKANESFSTSTDVRLEGRWHKLAQVSVVYMRDFEQITSTQQDIKTKGKYYFYVTQAGTISVSLYKSTDNSSSTTVHLYDEDGTQLDSEYMGGSSYSYKTGSLSYTVSSGKLYYLTTDCATVLATLGGSASPMFVTEYCDQTVVTATEGSMLTLPTPTRSGYTFAGWQVDDTVVGEQYTVVGDVTLTALWSVE